MDFEEYIKEKREQEEKERLEFLNKCGNKVRDNDELIYRLLALGLCQRFNLKLSYNGEPPYIVYSILNYYVDNINIDWDEWLMSEDAPLIRPISELKKVFPELAVIVDDNEKIVELANRLYGLELKTDYDHVFNHSDYFFATSFNFNDFKPLPVVEIKKLKNEKEILNKYSVDTTELDKKLSEFGLTDEELEVI